MERIYIYICPQIFNTEKSFGKYIANTQLVSEGARSTLFMYTR